MENMEINEPNAQTFTLFSKLPTEMRLAIWDFAAFVESRIVHVTLCVPPYEPPTAYTQIPLPSIFSTCHDSRKTALQHYQTSWKDPQTTLLPDGICYNPIIDILFFDALSPDGEYAYWKFSDYLDKKDVKHVAVASEKWPLWTQDATPWFAQSLTTYPNLETFHRICYDKRPFTGLSLPSSLISVILDCNTDLWFHKPYGFMPNGRLEFDHVLNLDELVTPNDSGTGDGATIVTRSRASYLSLPEIFEEMNIGMNVFEDHEKKNPGWKRPIIRIGHLTVDGVPYCHSYKNTAEEVAERIISGKKDANGPGT